MAMNQTVKMCARYVNNLFHYPGQPLPSSSSTPTGGKGSFTLWVHGGFMVGFE
jgi:hypothetical protein